MIDLVVRLGRATALLFLEMAPYLLLGLTVAGVLNVLVHKSFVARHIGTSGPGAVVKAAALGVPLPLCSCGVLPASTYLRRAGGSKPAVMSFLISTPQTGVDSIVATYGMLGPLFAIFRPLAALVIGILGGLGSIFFEKRWSNGGGPDGKIDSNKDTIEEGSSPRAFKARFRSFWHYAYVESVDSIAMQFLVGLLIAGAITLVVPDDFFVGRTFGSGLPAMLLMVVVGIPMYICATSSIPIALALLAKGLSPGAAYVFLVAGPATNAATLAVLSKTLGRRQTILFVATVVLGSLAFGPIMNVVAAAIGWTPPLPVGGGGMHVESLTVSNYLLAAALGGLIIASLFRRWHSNLRSAAGSGTPGSLSVMMVEGMTCDCCAAAVERAVSQIEGVDDVQVDLKGKHVSYRGAEEALQVAEAIREAGYEPVVGAKSR